MEHFNDSTAKVRSPRARYGASPPEPDRYPAELVLRDLRRVGADAEVPLVLARYAVLRAWLLSTAASDSGLVEHARLTADAHLDASPADWPEAALLRRLMASPGEEPWELLVEIAVAAEAAGHVDGALAARQAAWAAAASTNRFDVAAVAAADTAALLRRRGDERGARGWVAAARWLARAAARSAPPAAE